jgi:hypothetical protein
MIRPMLALPARARRQADVIVVLCLAALLRLVVFVVAAGSPQRF